jgi:hypothetical protein
MLHSGIHSAFILLRDTYDSESLRKRCGCGKTIPKLWNSRLPRAYLERGVGSIQGKLEATPGIEPGYTVLQTVA